MAQAHCWWDQGPRMKGLRQPGIVRAALNEKQAQRKAVMETAGAGHRVIKTSPRQRSRQPAHTRAQAFHLYANYISGAIWPP